MAASKKKRTRDAFLIRLPPEVLDAVKALAADELRSANAQIEVLLREALARRGRSASGFEGDTDGPVPHDGQS